MTEWQALRECLFREISARGNSHLLAHLEHLALSRNFVCSRVAISKETPLYDLGKVFTSAMENGRIPNQRGRFIEELALFHETRFGGVHGLFSLGRQRRLEWPFEHDVPPQAGSYTNGREIWISSARSNPSGRVTAY